MERKERKRSPAAPFTTSTLQQEAARKLGFGARKTMSIAQRLYEGVDLAGEGTVGLITYMRTDSVNLAETALREVAEVVRTEFGGEYTIAEPRRFKTRARNAQEAHEAIRPTSVLRSPARVASALDRDQLRLYTMIWQRTVASQMADARFNQVGVDIEATAEDGARYGLRATGQTLLFDGFIRVYSEGRDDSSDEDAESRLPELTAEQVLRCSRSCPSSTSRSRRPVSRRPRWSRPWRSSASAGRPPTPRSSPRSRTAATCAWRTSASSPRTSPRS